MGQCDSKEERGGSEEEWDFQYSDHTSVSPTGIFCASNDDDAWKPHEFYELISPHTQEDLLGLCCRTEQNCFTRLIIIVKSLKIFFNELNQEGGTNGLMDGQTTASFSKCSCRLF